MIDGALPVERNRFGLFAERGTNPIDGAHLGIERHHPSTVSAVGPILWSMTLEIERKFLLTELPEPSILGTGQPMRQGYVAEQDDVAVRVRIADASAQLTIKAGAGLVRTEVELQLTADQAESLWRHTEGRRLAKVRHRVSLGSQAGLTAEVDVYAGELAGLATVEVEFASQQDAAAFVPPSWFGREVTGEGQWTNAALARKGLPR